MIGKSIGRYKIIDKLGEGGMGTVWKAEDTTLGRMVALKFLSTDIPDDEERARFLREARAASALDHPGICTIYEAEEDEDGRPYLAMAYCDGESLRERIKKGPLPLDEALRITVQIGEALARANEKGIVHRDIKPANLLFSSEGTPRITDFGLAAYQGATRLTKTGTSMGTVAYASPEQLTGQEVDQRADIWSLGVVLYEMLVGEVPFTAEHEQGMVHKILSEDPEPVTARRAGVPLELDRILSKVLAKDPGQRYQHVDDMLVDLEQVQSTKVGSQVRESDSSSPAFNRALKKGHWLKYALSMVFIVGVALALLIMNITSGPGVTRLAILPIGSMGSDDTAVLASGLRTSLYQSLVRFESLQPVALSTIDARLDQGEAPLESARRCGASYALESRIQLVSDEEGETKVQISGEILTLEDNQVLLPFSYITTWGDLFSVQNQLTKEILDILSLRITTAERAGYLSIPSSNPQAIQAYLRGVAARRILSERFDTARDHFKEATEHDPRFAWAWAQLAETNSHSYHVYGTPVAADSLARAAIEQAEALSVESPIVVRARGYYEYYVQKNFRLAEAAFRRAADLNPGDPETHYIRALNLRRTGEWEKAFKSFDTALELDPQWDRLLYNYATSLMMIRDFDGAEDLISMLRAVETGVQHPMWPERLALLEILSTGEASRSLELARQDPEAVAYYLEYSLAPYRRLLLRYFAAEFDSYPFDSTSNQFHLTCAQIAIGMGQKDAAVAHYDSFRSSFTVDLANVNRGFQSWWTYARGFSAAATGQVEEAVRYGLEAVSILSPEKDPVEGIDAVHALAEIYLLCEEYDEAVNTLEWLLDIPSYCTVASLRTDPMWQPLYNHEGFRRLVGWQ
ncbi:protein kinase [Gemmatimonadota bacterium]